MKVIVQVVFQSDDDEGRAEVREVFHMDREALSSDTLGLQLGEAKDLLTAVQSALVDKQAKTALAAQVACPQCGTARRHKDKHTIVVRSLFGTLRLASPRWFHCPCSPHGTRSFSPLAEVIPERTTPELVYLEAKFAGLVSYGLSATLLGEILPLGRPLHASVLRTQVQATAQCLENELGPEQTSFIDSCPAEWAQLPRPDLPLVVGLDGGYVHSSEQRSRRDGWFEVIAGKSVPAEGPAKCFGFVQTYDTRPKRRLFETLRSQGMQMNQQVTFVTDGADDVRDLPLLLNPQAEHLLDWFHVTMRLTVMGNMAKGLGDLAPTDSSGWAGELDEDDLAHYREIVTGIPGELERLKWYLWHGNVFRALQITDDLEFDLEVIEGDGPEYQKLLKTVREFGGYLRLNALRGRRGSRERRRGGHHRRLCPGPVVGGDTARPGPGRGPRRRPLHRGRGRPLPGPAGRPPLPTDALRSA